MSANSTPLGHSHRHQRDDCSADYIAAIALSETGGEHGNIMFGNGADGIRFLGLSSTTIPSDIGSGPSCTINAEGICNIHLIDHRLGPVRGNIARTDDDVLNFDLSETTPAQFSQAVRNIARLVKCRVPRANHLAVLTAIIHKFTQFPAYDAIAAQVRPAADPELQALKNFMTGEVDVMDELDMPRGPLLKRSIGAADEQHFTLQEFLADDSALPRGWSSPVSVASAPATFSSHDSESASSPTSLPSSIYTPSPHIILSAGDSPVPFDPLLGPAFDNKLLEYYQACFENAQDHLPGDAVLFVGNLPAGYTDLQLINVVTKMFREIFPCFVNVARTYSKHDVKPHALVQFYTPIAADSAWERAQGKSIGGRDLRVEKSRAKRTVRVTRGDGSLPHPQEIAASLGPFGDFQRVYVSHNRVDIMYTCYGSFLRAKEALRAHRIAGLLPA